ncbi:ABC transporter permease [Acidobacteriota bacterium]
MNPVKITYEPDNSLKKGYVSLFREIYLELKKNRWLTYQFFKRDFLALYKQSFLGIFWAIIIPLIGVGTFIILNNSGVFVIDEMKVPYPVYAVLGMAFWQFFATGLATSSDSLVKAGSMIIRINFSKKSLIIAAASLSIVPFLVQFILVIVLFFIFKISPSIAILCTPFFLIPLLLLMLGLGLILALLNGVMRDIGKVLPFLITFLMFLTPVLYEKPSEGILALFTKYNPLYYLISMPREIILQGTMSEWRGYLLASALSAICFVFSLIVFHLTEKRVAERI